MGKYDEGLDRISGGEAFEQGRGEAGVEECFVDMTVEEFPGTEKFPCRLVREADVRLGIDQEKGVAECVEESVAFIMGLGEINLEAELPCIECGGSLPAGAAVIEFEDD